MLLYILSVIALVLTLINAVTMRVVSPYMAQLVDESVGLLVPMRNEERNVEEVIPALLDQKELSRYEIIVINDGSTDNTAALLQKFGSKISVKNGAPLPEGWMGKSHALHYVAMRSTSEYLVFVDADVRLNPHAVAAAISSMKRWGWDFSSPYPKQIAKSLLELLIQPLLQWSWLASVPLLFAERMKVPSMVIANGQFFIVKRAAYIAIGGHESIKGEVLDDLELARALSRAGFTGGVAEGSAVATCRMYNTGEELTEGYTKSLWRAFGSPIGTFIAVAILFWTGIFPVIAVANGSSAALLALDCIMLSRIIAALRTRTNPVLAFLHPAAVFALIILIALSWKRKSEGRLQWRGRTLS